MARRGRGRRSPSASPRCSRPAAAAATTRTRRRHGHAASTATTYTQGVITGFGSVIVGGVRFDDSLAAVRDDDGNARNRSELRLGMMVEVDAGSVDRAAASAQAMQIRWGSEIVGPVGRDRHRRVHRCRCWARRCW